MKIYDFHAHIYPEKISERAVKGISDFYNIDMCEDGTSNTLIKIGSDAGITDFLVHSVATSSSHVEKINDFIFSECNKYTNFHGFGTMHQDYDNKIREAERLISLGLKGIKIHPDTQEFNIDDERMFPLYDFMQDKLALLIHCGDYRYDYSHPRRLKRILNCFPHLTVIGAHFGGWSVPDLALEYIKNENCYIDTSSSIMYMGKIRARELINIYGSERVVFGSDYPMWNPNAELECVLSLGLKESEYDNILYKNAEKILKIN